LRYNGNKYKVIILGGNEMFRPVATQQITENVYAVRTLFSNFYIYSDEENTICFDTGFISPIIKGALSKLNIKADSISHIFLTHSDFDHVGGINLLKNGQVFLSTDEEQMITFKKPRKLFVFNKRIKRNYKLLKDGEVTYIGSTKVQAIATPGHTPGSMCYLVNDSILFAGDNVSLHNGSMKSFSFLQNMNTRQQKESIKKLLNLDNLKLICTGHYGYLKK
jgi:glyoxylase-like metal-dependent hydrolase (beta-lactamase superfamily II)